MMVDMDQEINEDKKEGYSHSLKEKRKRECPQDESCLEFE